ncbi:MAG: hypothetical protein GY778_31000 [bacterium]|nr:hypothetical protein [bacterium]
MMDRVFLGLVVGVTLVLLGTGVVGLMVTGDEWLVHHLALALFGAMLAALIHVVTYTYFTVTGKAVQQVVALGRLDEGSLARTRHHKRVVSWCVAIGMLPLVVTVALGAHVIHARSYATYHLVAGVVALIANLGAWALEFRHIRNNQCLVGEVMGQYHQQKRP